MSYIIMYSKKSLAYSYLIFGVVAVLFLFVALNQLQSSMRAQDEQMDNFILNLSNDLNAGNVSFRDRLDVMKVYLPTSYLNNPEFTAKRFSNYKINCSENFGYLEDGFSESTLTKDNLDSCFQFNSTKIFCSLERCEVVDFELEDPLNLFLSSENLNDLKERSSLLGNSYNGFLDNIGLDLEGFTPNDKEIISNYTDFFPLPYKYVSFGKLPDSEVENLENSFNYEAKFSQTIMNLVLYGITSVGVAGDAFDFALMGLKSNFFAAHPHLIDKIANFQDSFAFVKDVEKSDSTISKIGKLFTPDVLKYDPKFYEMTGRKIGIFRSEVFDVTKAKEISDIAKQSYKRITTAVDEDSIDLGSEFKEIFNEELVTKFGYELKGELSEELISNLISDDFYNTKDLLDLRSVVGRKSTTRALFKSFSSFLKENDELPTFNKFLSLFKREFRDYIKDAPYRNFIDEHHDNVVRSLFSKIRNYDGDNVASLLTDTQKDILKRGLLTKYSFLNDPKYYDLIDQDFDGFVNSVFSRKYLKQAFLSDMDIGPAIDSFDGDLIRMNEFAYSNFDEAFEVLGEKFGYELSEGYSDFIFQSGSLSLKRAVSDEDSYTLLMDSINSFDFSDLDLTDKFLIKNKFGQGVSLYQDEYVRVLKNSETYVVPSDVLYNVMSGDKLGSSRDEILSRAFEEFKKTENYDSIVKSVHKSIDITSGGYSKTVRGISKGGIEEATEEIKEIFPLVDGTNTDEIIDSIRKIKNGELEISSLNDIDNLELVSPQRNIYLDGVFVQDQGMDLLEASGEFDRYYNKILPKLSSMSEKRVDGFLDNFFSNPDNFDSSLNDMENLLLNNPDYFKKVSSSLPEGFWEKFSLRLKDPSIYKNSAYSSFQGYVTVKCSDLYLKSLQDGEIDMNLDQSVQNFLEDSSTLNSFVDMDSSVKNIFISALDDSVSEIFGSPDDAISALGQAAFCVRFGSLTSQTLATRAVFNLIEYQRLYYLPNTDSYTDSISFFNQKNMYSQDRMEFFSPFQISDFENSIMRLKKDEGQYENFYLMSPCFGDLAFEKTEDISCNYGPGDYIYNGFVLEGEVESLDCDIEDYFTLDDYSSCSEELNDFSSEVSLTACKIYNNTMLDSSKFSLFISSIIDPSMEAIFSPLLASHAIDNEINLSELYDDYFDIISKTYSFLDLKSKSSLPLSNFIDPESYFFDFYMNSDFSLPINTYFNENISQSGRFISSRFVKYPLPMFGINYREAENVISDFNDDLSKRVDYLDLVHFCNEGNCKKYFDLLKMSESEKITLCSEDFLINSKTCWNCINNSNCGKLQYKVLTFDGPLSSIAINLDLSDPIIYSDFLDVNKLKHFKISNSFFPIVVKKDSNSPTIIDFNDNSIKLSESELESIKDSFARKSFEDASDDYYVFDIVYLGNVDSFTYEDYLSYFRIFQKMPSFYNGVYIYKNQPFRVTDNSNYLLLNFQKFKFPTLMQTIIYSDYVNSNIQNSSFVLNKENSLNDIANYLNSIFKLGLEDYTKGFFELNSAKYYDCSNEDYSKLLDLKISKTCPQKPGKITNDLVSSIDVSVFKNTNEKYEEDTNYCYMKMSKADQFYNENSGYVGMTMAFTNFLQFIPFPPLQMGVIAANAAWDIYDMYKSVTIDKNNKWPKSGA